MQKRARSLDTDNAGLDALYKRPGFLIRRAHQISVALFVAEAADLGITTTQYGVLVILRSFDGLDQISLSRKVGLDRSTTALVVKKLQAERLVVRIDDPEDARRKIIVLTAAGERMLERVKEPARRAREKALEAFSGAEAHEFLRLLGLFVDKFNSVTRAPIID